MKLGSNRSGALAALAMAVALAGCTQLDTSEAWFRKPFDMSGRSGGYTFSDVGEARHDRPITENDLVDANGACPQAAAPPQAQPENVNEGGPAAPPDASSLVGGGVALGMSECDVVAMAGQPSAVQLGNTPNGDRNAVLTFSSGPRAGIYRFERGRLMEMDGVAQPAPPPKIAKKKAAKPPKKNDQS